MSERKIALITGGSRGIGFSCAKELANAGCDIIINDICDAATAQPAIDEIKALGVNAWFYQFDVSNDEQVKEAVDKIRKGDKYDLILLDEDMPYMNGISVMNKLNKIKGFDTKVILLTKNSNIIYDDIYKDSGFSDYIIKPIDKDDLMNKINKYL